MTGQSEKPKNKWRRRLIVFAVIVGCYFAAGEAFRAYARAELEKDMRANFEKLGCPPGQVQGDVCLAYPDEGRCISGEYIDYRTVWRRVYFEWGATRLIQREFDRLDNDRRKLANWLACQGFSSIAETADLRNWPTGYRTAGPKLWNTKSNTISARLRWRGGFGAVATTFAPVPIRVFHVGIFGGISITLSVENSAQVAVSRRGFFAK